MRQSNEIMKGDEELVNDHRYYCRNGNYLTPPQTPRSEGESSATTMRSTPAILPKDFNHYYTYADFYDNEDEERFFDFAEDFQDLRLPMLKQDCMWGTAAQINHESSCEKAADYAKNQEVDSIRHRTHFVATPSILDARMTCLTPCNFIERSSSIFAPISNEHSTNDINSKGRDVNHICIRDKASDYLNDSALLLSPNETESEEEIDVVGLIEKVTGTELSDAQNTELVNPDTKPKPEDINPPEQNKRCLQEEVKAQRSPINKTTGGVRISHNDLERKRRDELKRKFENLRTCVPELENNDRAPKVLILRKAQEFIPKLQEEESRLLFEKESLKIFQCRLMEKLVHLSRR